MRDLDEQEARGWSELIALLQGDERISAAFVFGSAARNELKHGSDLDVAIIPADGDSAARIRENMGELVGELGVANGRDVHVVDLEMAGHILRFQVFRDGVRLFDRDRTRTANLLERTLRERFDWLPAMAEMDRIMGGYPSRDQD